MAARAQDAATRPLQHAMDRPRGVEAAAAGHLGTGPDWTDGEHVSFATAGPPPFPVVFDAGREGRCRLDGCAFRMFGGTPCPATVMAELGFDGARVWLIVFAIGRPERHRRA